MSIHRAFTSQMYTFNKCVTNNLIFAVSTYSMKQFFKLLVFFLLFSEQKTFL